jgi:hypothetical protein
MYSVKCMYTYMYVSKNFKKFSFSISFLLENRFDLEKNWKKTDKLI